MRRRRPWGSLLPGRLWAASLAVLPAGLFLGALLASNAASADDLESDAVYVPAAGARSLSVRNPLGAVSVSGWDRPEVRIIAHKRASSAAVLSRLRVRVDFGDGRVRVAAGFYLADRTFNMLPLPGAAIDLVIEAPREVALSVTTFEGDVDAAGFRAGAKLSSQQGRLRASDIEGPVDTRALDGDQWLEDIHGSLDARGAAGDVDLVDVRGQTVDARVIHGRISARNVEAQVVQLQTTAGTVLFIGPLHGGSRYDLRSRDGDVRLMLEGAAPFRLTALSPTLRSALPLTAMGNEPVLAGAPRAFVRANAAAGQPASIHLVSARGAIDLQPAR